MCLSKLNQQREALALITESEKELDKTVGKVHPLAIKAVLAQSKVYEAMDEFDLSLKCLNQALERAKASPLGLNTDQMEKRKLELTNKTKKAK